MEHVRDLISEGRSSAVRVSEWTQHEVEMHRRMIGGYITELRPRKRVRTQQPEPRHLPVQASRNMAAQIPLPTQPSRAEDRHSPVHDSTKPTTPPVLELRDNPSIIIDTMAAPSVLPTFQLTGQTVASSLQPNGMTGRPAESTPAATAVTAASSTPSPQQAASGMNGTTMAIVISASIAGAIVLISAIVLCSVCYRRKKRSMIPVHHPLTAVPTRSKSTSTLNSEGWRSEFSAEPEKQSLMRAGPASRSPSPAARTQQTPSSVHNPQRSVAGFRPFLANIPESQVATAEQAQPMSPTSIYTKGVSPPQPRDVGELQVEQPLSPLRPPPLRLTDRRPSDAPVGTALLPSPKNPFASVRIPFFSGTPSNAGARRSSIAHSMGSTAYGDEEQGLARNRRTVESDTLPKAGGYRDSLWSVAASSFWGSSGSNKIKSGYSEWNAVPSSAALSHSRSISGSSRGGHSRGQSTIDYGSEIASSVGVLPGRMRRHSSLNTGTFRTSDGLVPAMPPMPSAAELQEQYGHKTNLSNASELSANAAENVQLKGRLHSVDFWAREEREMRLGTFEPAELEGSPSPSVMLAPPTLSSGSTPRDSRGSVIGAAIPGTPSKGFTEQGPRETMSRARLGADPYANASVVGTGSATLGASGGMQGGYSVTIDGGNSPPMPQGYTQESEDGRRFWSRARSRSRSRGRNSASTVETVFRQHPGDMVMI